LNKPALAFGQIDTRLPSGPAGTNLSARPFPWVTRARGGRRGGFLSLWRLVVCCVRWVQEKNREPNPDKPEPNFYSPQRHRGHRGGLLFTAEALRTQRELFLFNPVRGWIEQTRPGLGPNIFRLGSFSPGSFGHLWCLVVCCVRWVQEKNR
jgi:hypothetical protein